MAGLEEMKMASGQIGKLAQNDVREEAYSLNNGAVLIVRTEDYGNGNRHISAAIGTLHNAGGPIQLSGFEAVKKLRDLLVKHVPFTLAEVNAMVPEATARELTK